MKKIVSLTIALCLVVLVCVPSLSVKADDSVNYRFYSYQSVDGSLDNVSVFDYSNEKKNNILKTIYNRDTQNYSLFYDAIQNLPQNLSDCDGVVITYIPEYSQILGYFFDKSQIDGYVYSDRVVNSPVVNNSNSNLSLFFSVIGSNSNYNPLRYSYNASSHSWSVSSGTYYSGTGYKYSTGFVSSLLYSNVKVLSRADYDYLVGGTSLIRDSLWNNKEDFYDYSSLNNNIGYINDGGQTEFPSSVSFSDTSYNGGISFDYQQTHLYTEYNNAQGANETCVFKWALDTRSQSITQTTNDWKMHYYVVVNWHWTQATDSSVYTPLLSGGSGGQMAFEFDDVPEFIMQGKSQISIWDLVQNVPTVSSVRDEDIVSLAVAVSCLNGNIVNSVWRDIFGQSGQYVGDVASEIISGGKLEVQGVGELGGSFINNLFNPAYYYALDDLRINLVAHPWSETLAIHGGNGDFDLNFCSNESYGTTQGYVDDGGTPDDPTDDTHYPTNNVPSQNNVVVPVVYPTSGGNVTVYSVVQVPDSGGGGGNSINYSPTFSPSIVMDSGLDDLKETVDAYPQVPNQHFWDYFLVFKDNAFLDATSDFFGALPNELSSLLISSIGIIGVFAIYRFVRRR